MVVKSGSDAVKRANGYSHCDPGMCLKYVRTWLDIPSREPDAISAWNNAKHKHAESKNASDAQHPPKGAPVFWKGGQHGHIALAVNTDNGRSTDTPSSGVVGTKGGDWWRQNWGVDYLGWTEDLNGVDIPYLRDGGSSEYAGGDVYVEKLVRKTQDSDSVARLCYRLIHHNAMPSSHRPPHLVHNYTEELLEAVRYWQRNIMSPKVNGPTDGTSMSNPQSNQLFGSNYNVIEK